LVGVGVIVGNGTGVDVAGSVTVTPTGVDGEIEVGGAAVTMAGSAVMDGDGMGVDVAGSVTVTPTGVDGEIEVGGAAVTTAGSAVMDGDVAVGVGAVQAPSTNTNKKPASRLIVLSKLVVLPCSRWLCHFLCYSSMPETAGQALSSRLMASLVRSYSLVARPAAGKQARVRGDSWLSSSVD
jgi:hypothetical protein